MVGCLSRNPEFLPRSNQFLTSRTHRFNSRETLLRLQKCSYNFQHLKQIHALIIRNNLSHDPLLLTKLLRRYFSLKRMDYATLVFRQIPNPLTFTWNLMIRAHTIHSNSNQALLLYNLMVTRSVPPDKFTFPFVIKACSISSSIDMGKQVHALALKTGFYKDIFLHNTLIDFYCKCGVPGFARKVFDKMRVRNVVSWTTMAAGLVSCEELEVAREVFERMPVRNVVSWTAMINGYARNRQPEEAFELFQRMQLDNVRPNEFTLVSLLVACTELGSLKLGNWIDDFCVKNGFKLNAFLGTTLIDMYSKCGSLEDAKRVFDSMEEKSVATWNSMITSLGVHGRGEEALALFAQMEKAEIVPDDITFVGVLCACVHKGLVEEGCKHFQNMKERYGIAPTIDHYGCMVELLERAGLLGNAYELVRDMPMRPSNDIQEALLRARRMQDVADLEDQDAEDMHSKECNGLSDASLHHQSFKWEVG